MNSTNQNIAVRLARLLALTGTAGLLALAPAARAAAPGVTGTAFGLTASPAYLTQPDGHMIYSWGYACATGGKAAPSTIDASAACNGTMQVPGPTLVVTEGTTVQVTLTNNLPPGAGNTSILFPGFDVSTTGGVPGLLTMEAAANGGTVTYSFVASSPGTRAYYSGTQGDLQIEMGLYGAVIVLPAATPTACTTGIQASNLAARAYARPSPSGPEKEFRHAAAAYGHSRSCYDREYLFQFSEIDPAIHDQVLVQVTPNVACVNAGGAFASCARPLQVTTEPYHPAYFMINGRSMPDDMDPNYAPHYPHQPYNGNPHMHPGELVLLRIVGQGRWQHPFHEHANHVRVLARDGNLILSADDSPTNPSLAGPLLFTTTTTPGQAMDGIFYYTGKGLNWDMYGHNPATGATLACTPDANGYNTGGNAYQAANYFEWCADHEKPVESKPLGNVAAGGPVTLPDANVLTNGAWYGGSPYLGPDATGRAVGATPIPPSGTVANSPTGEAGFAFMWHSHNEREITTNNVFPGGMMMMMLVDPRGFVIDESL